MPRKRIKFKGKKVIDLTKLTDDLYESICKDVSMAEMMREYDYDKVGLKYSYWFMFDKSDPKICKEVWDLHKATVMEKWRSDKLNSYKRPWLWYKCEAKEGLKIIGYEDFPLNVVGFYNGEPCFGDEKPIYEKHPVYESEREYLTRVKKLEPWELAELVKDKTLLGGED